VRIGVELREDPVCLEAVDKLGDFTSGIIEITKNASLLMTGLYAIRLVAFAYAILAERAFADKPLLMIDITRTIRTSVDTDLAAHAFRLVNPDNPILILL